MLILALGGGDAAGGAAAEGLDAAGGALVDFFDGLDAGAVDAPGALLSGVVAVAFSVVSGGGRGGGFRGVEGGGFGDVAGLEAGLHEGAPGEGEGEGEGGELLRGEGGGFLGGSLAVAGFLAGLGNPLGEVFLGGDVLDEFEHAVGLFQLGVEGGRLEGSEILEVLDAGGFEKFEGLAVNAVDFEEIGHAGAVS